MILHCGQCIQYNILKGRDELYYLTETSLKILLAIWKQRNVVEII